KPDRAALAVVEDVRRLMNDEVGERVVGEVVRRDVAGRLLAEPDETWGLLAEQLRANAQQVQVRELPRRAVPGVVQDERLDRRAGHVHDGLFERREYPRRLATLRATVAWRRCGRACRTAADPHAGLAPAWRSSITAVAPFSAIIPSATPCCPR